MNSLYPDQAYVTVAGLSVDILIQGNKNRNRALNGDIVVVQLNSVAAWRPMDDEVDRETMATGEPPFATSSDTDEAVLHSLWLPTVQADQCFIKSARNEEELKMMEPRLVFINDTVRRRLRRPTASVVFILERGNSTELVGAFGPLTNGSDNAYFNPHDPRAPRRVLIPRTQLPDDFLTEPELYTKKMLSTCRITTWPATDKFPTGDFIKIVGEYTDIEARLSAALAKHGLQSHTLDFDTSILDELDEKYGINGEKWEVPEDELEKRRDFRDTQIFSIDPYDTRDLDDALHITALNEARTKFEIGVHIADVTHFMEHDSLLDREARSRATSVYLANRVLPMLPRILCEKLCSLQPQVDRLAFSVVWQMNVDGTLVDGLEPWFGKSIIRSCCKLDYGSAQKMLDGVISADNVEEREEDRRPIPGASPNITNATVIQSVKDLWSIGKNRRAMRFETGAVSLSDVKLVFSLDEKGNPTRYGPYELKDSNHLVEEYMLLANYLVAQQLLRVHGPLAFLRHHPPPVQRSMGRAREQLRKYGIEMGSNPKELMESLSRIREERGKTVFALVQAILIKPMKPAQYSVAGNAESPDSWRHFALNIPYYTHFTSPIRRYADVVVHRLLQESIERPSTPATFESEDLDTRLAELTSIAQTCSTKKDTAKYAKNDCDEVYLSAYLQLHGEVEVTGVVESMGSTSFTVYFPELGMMKRLSLKDIKLKGKWDRQAAQLSISLPEEPENWITLSFMK